MKSHTFLSLASGALLLALANSEPVYAQEVEMNPEGPAIDSPISQPDASVDPNQSEAIMESRLLTASNIPASAEIAKVKIMGALNDIPDTQFKMQATVNDQPTDLAYQVVAGTGKAFRDIEIQVPANPESVERKYRFTFNATGSNTVFQEEHGLTITQAAGRTEDPDSVEAPLDQDLVGFRVESATYLPDQNRIRVRFFDSVRVRPQVDLASRIQLDLGDHDSVDQPNPIQSLTFEDQDLVLNLRDGAVREPLSLFANVKIKENSLLNSKNQANQAIIQFVRQAKPKITAVLSEDPLLYNDQGGLVRLRLQGSALIDPTQNPNSGTRVTVTHLTALDPVTGKVDHLDVTVTGGGSEQLVTFTLPINTSDKAVSYEVKILTDSSPDYEEILVNGQNPMIYTVAGREQKMDEAMISFIRIQSYGSKRKTSDHGIPDITHTTTATNQSSKKTEATIYGANLDRKQTWLVALDRKGVIWDVYPEATATSGGNFAIVAPDTIGILGGGNRLSVEVIGPNTIQSDESFTYYFTVDGGQTYHQDDTVSVTIANDQGQRPHDLDRDLMTVPVHYQDEAGQILQEAGSYRGYPWFYHYSVKHSALKQAETPLKEIRLYRGDLLTAQVDRVDQLSQSERMARVDRIVFVYEVQADNSSKSDSDQETIARPIPGSSSHGSSRADLSSQSSNTATDLSASGRSAEVSKVGVSASFPQIDQAGGKDTILPLPKGQKEALAHSGSASQTDTLAELDIKPSNQVESADPSLPKTGSSSYALLAASSSLILSGLGLMTLEEKKTQF